MKHKPRKITGPKPQKASKSASPSIPCGVEMVPIDPAIREKVREILKSRGFSRYQTA